MAWIKVDPSEITQLKKFHDFRVACGWHSFLAQGALYSFWGKVAELKESGEISDWTPDYLAVLVSLVNIKPQRFWDALLQNNDWIEARENGQLFVRDWIDIAGPYLKQKYHTSNPQKLVYIWGLHGRTYSTGRKTDSSPDQPQGMGKEPEPPPGSGGQDTFRNPNGNAVERGVPFSTPLPLTPKRSGRLINPSGSGITTPDAKSRPEVILLIQIFREKQTERLLEPPAKFNYGAAGKGFKDLLQSQPPYTPQDIEERFDAFFLSTKTFVVERGFCVEDFFTYFNRLKNGPNANQVGSNGKRPFNDGLGSLAVVEHELSG